MLSKEESRAHGPYQELVVKISLSLGSGLFYSMNVRYEIHEIAADTKL